MMLHLYGFAHASEGTCNLPYSHTLRTAGDCTAVVPAVAGTGRYSGCIGR
jgi:hypothetical protein